LKGQVLHYAAAAGNVDAIDVLLKNGASLDARNAYGVTPLAVAVTTGRSAAVARLLGAGAGSTKVLLGGLLHIAAALTGSAEVTQQLLAAGCDPNAPLSTSRLTATGLLLSSFSIPYHFGYRTEASMMCYHGQGGTPLMLASFLGHRDCARRLLDARADPQLRNKRGLRAVDLAKVHGHDNLLHGLMDF